MKLKIRNWDKWQSYRKDRGQPPWVKLHRSLLRDPEWVALTDAQRGQLVSIWMLAADHDGAIPSDPSIIQKICFMDSPLNLKVFEARGFIEGRGLPDARLTPERRQSDAPDKSREEKIRDREEKNTPQGGDLIPFESKPKALTPVQRIVEGWKLLNGVDRNDKAWDKVHYKPCLSHAKRLLDLFGDDASAALDCMESVFENLKVNKGLDLSIAGVVKNSDTFRQMWLERKAKKPLQVVG